MLARIGKQFFLFLVFVVLFFFFNDTATTEIYTLSLHDALPIFKDAFANGYDAGISIEPHMTVVFHDTDSEAPEQKMADNFIEYGRRLEKLDRKSTRLNSSHKPISYAVFCLKKKKNH